MQEVFKIFILSSVAITLWTALLLFLDKRGVKRLNRWFAVFLLALTAPQMDLYTTLVLHQGVFELWVVASTFLWLKGPFIWVFLTVLTRNYARGMWIHFVPWLFVLIALSVFPQNAKMFMLLGMGHMITYLVFSLICLVKKRRYIADLWQGFQNTAYYWLLYIIIGLMALVAIDFVVMSLFELGLLKTYDLLELFAFPIFSVFVLSVGVLCVFRPELLFRDIPESTSNDEISTQANLEAVPSAPAPNIQLLQTIDQKERHLELDVSLAKTLMHQMTQLMEAEQVYRQNELSLADLALQLGISVHQLSELLNVHQGINFYDYINGYRLKYACVLLADPKCHLRILDIAFEAGFNNKNSFYRTFKDNLGVTPNQYRFNAVEMKTSQYSSV